MCNAEIITLYKHRGTRSGCNNHKGISLLKIAGKTFALVIIPHIPILPERVYPESQCGLRSQHSTTNMIFSVRQLQEKCKERSVPLYIAFVYLTKAFDLACREKLFGILLKIGYPPSLFKIVKSFYSNTKTNVQYDGNFSDSFMIKRGITQRCLLLVYYQKALS